MKRRSYDLVLDEYRRLEGRVYLLSVQGERLTSALGQYSSYNFWIGETFVQKTAFIGVFPLEFESEPVCAPVEIAVSPSDRPNHLQVKKIGAWDRGALLKVTLANGWLLEGTLRLVRPYGLSLKLAEGHKIFLFRHAIVEVEVLLSSSEHALGRRYRDKQLRYYRRNNKLSQGARMKRYLGLELEPDEQEYFERRASHRNKTHEPKTHESDTDGTNAKGAKAKGAKLEAGVGTSSDVSFEPASSRTASSRSVSTEPTSPSKKSAKPSSTTLKFSWDALKKKVERFMVNGKLKLVLHQNPSRVIPMDDGLMWIALENAPKVPGGKIELEGCYIDLLVTAKMWKKSVKKFNALLESTGLNPLRIVEAQVGVRDGRLAAFATSIQVTPGKPPKEAKADKG